jgi:hypothetical protein
MVEKESSKKEKVLHTRVSEDLEKDLKSKATQLGVSVSNLVRNTLLNTMDLVENVVADGARVAGSAKDLTGPDITQPQKNTIVGWQELTLNLNAVCEQCNEILPKGQKAGVGLPMSQTPVVRCLPCLPMAVASEEQA